jgi:hypothetical protein
MPDPLVSFYQKLAAISLRQRANAALQRTTEPGAGVAGPQGEQGPPGPQGDVGPAPEHQWIDTSLQFQEPSGAWGPLVNLKGDPGETRVVHVSTGVSGGGGGGPTVTNAYFPAGW